MIVHKLNNGQKGNQFFQVAATIGHAVKMQTKPVFPTWECNRFLLNPVNDNLNSENDNIFNNVMHEDHFGFGIKYAPIEKSNNLVLHGFFQSEKYFDHCREIIAHHLKPKFEFLKVVREAGKDFLNLQNVVAIHVRRGDYLKSQDRHPVLPMSYYINSLVEFSKKAGVPIKDINIVFFSDDIDWCKQNTLGHNVYFAEGNSDMVDLYLMASVKNHIIANSSFSWWASWISRNVFDNTGFTFAPTTWFGPAINQEESQDIYLSEWIKIDN